MASNKLKATEDDPQPNGPAGDDTKRHRWWDLIAPTWARMTDPTTARQLARGKEEDVDRASRERQRQKEASRR